MKKLSSSDSTQFNEVLQIIQSAHDRALKAVNTEMIQMYWNVGAYLSRLCADANFGDKVIDEVAAYIAHNNPGVKGFNRRGLYRMKQFYELYKDDKVVSPLVTQISWTNHLLIMSGAKSAEERHFYLSLCAKEHYSKCELERQMECLLRAFHVIRQKTFFSICCTSKYSQQHSGYLYSGIFESSRGLLRKQSPQSHHPKSEAIYP